MSRRIDHHYTDPLDLVWLECAKRCGFDIARSPEVYASFDGHRTIQLSTRDDFDPDDSLAQLILHELCHALVSAPAGLRLEDWGLDNTSDKDLVFEHATHRLQAHLADRYELRHFFAVTTTWRSYWDRLPRDPLGDGDDPAIPLARAARIRADAEPFASALRQAFAKTVIMADLARESAPDDSLWRKVSDRVHRRHRHGQPLGPKTERCGTCAWGQLSACELTSPKLPPEHRAAQPDDPACIRWEPILDEAACAACGACCHKAFHLVTVDEGEPIVLRHPELLTPSGPERLGAAFHIDRPDGFCRALVTSAPPYRCRIYQDRPTSCRDFGAGSANCLEARRRVGLSPRT
ncbi:MAG TPA: YkgJ family cysteine cluster protein [Myxococcota bacterium]|nr:YkgJ family cysteine cluster protein [Myxococcota bacterium]